MSTPLPELSLEDRLLALANAVARERTEPDEPVVGHWTRLDRVSGFGVSGDLTRSESREMESLVWMLEHHLRYEHLEKPRDAVYEVLARSIADPTSDFIAWFQSEFARTPETKNCFLPVKHLGIERTQTLFGVALLPLDGDLIPAERFWMTLEPPVGCVALVNVEGTDPDKMLGRARATANRALRLLRVALREHIALNDRQLRFTLDDGYLFDATVEGRTQSSDTAYELSPADALFEFASQQALWALGDVPANDLEENVERATQWLERAMFEADTKVSTLFVFFALESLLGHSLGRLKGAAIAYRVMMLSHLAEGNFREPLTTAVMYKHVRSDVVHGDEGMDVSADQLARLQSVVRIAIRQCLVLAKNEDFTTRGRLCNHLEDHADRLLLWKWLCENYEQPPKGSAAAEFVEYARPKP